MAFANGMSLKEDPRAAAMEAALDARSQLDGPADLALVFFHASFAESAAAVHEAVREAAGPEALVGCSGEAIVGGPKEVEGPAVSVWLASGTGAETFRIGFDPASGAFPGEPEHPGNIVLLCDPFSFPADRWLAQVAERGGGSRVLGGMASGGTRPGACRLFHDADVLDHGAVGIRFPRDLEVRPLVSQGCRPVGPLLTITRAEQNIVAELAGAPPAEHIKRLYAEVSEEDKTLIASGLMIGLVVDEYLNDPGRGDFLVRGLLGADPATGAIAVGDTVSVGQTIRFHVRDASTADEDLRQGLETVERGPAAALLFTCNGRGTRLFGRPDHDAALVAGHFGEVPVAGMFCSGEIGPVGSRSFLHGFTASLALFY